MQLEPDRSIVFPDDYLPRSARQAVAAKLMPILVGSLGGVLAFDIVDGVMALGS